MDSLFERDVDFRRDRPLGCPSCGHKWNADFDWLCGYLDGEVGCPSCGVWNEGEERPLVDFDSTDPVLDDSFLLGAAWYHSSTFPDWPATGFDPQEGWSEKAKVRFQRKLPPAQFENWVKKQERKALHVGTFEAAVENMFRRMANENDAGRQFYLYRVGLCEEPVIAPGCNRERSGLTGDVQISDYYSAETQVVRYVNEYEDIGGISLALHRAAIATVQQVPIPLAEETAGLDENWIQQVITRIDNAPPIPEPEFDPTTKLGKFRARNEEHKRRFGKVPTPQSVEASNIAHEISQDLPPRIRDWFKPGFNPETYNENRTQYPKTLLGLVRLITHPEETLAALDKAAIRKIPET